MKLSYVCLFVCLFVLFVCLFVCLFACLFSRGVELPCYLVRSIMMISYMILVAIVTHYAISANRAVFFHQHHHPWVVMMQTFSSECAGLFHWKRRLV